MSYIKYKKQPANKPIAIWKKILILFFSLALTATVVILAYGETGLIGGYNFDEYYFDEYYNDYIASYEYEELYSWNYGYEGGYAPESYGGYYGHPVGGYYSGYVPKYIYAWAAGSDRDYSTDIEYFVEIGLLEVVENGVILHDIPELAYGGALESRGGYIGIQPFSDHIVPAGSAWAALQAAILLAPPVSASPPFTGHHPSQFEITIEAPVINAPSTGATFLLVGEGRNIRFVSDIPGQPGVNAQLVKTGGPLIQDIAHDHVRHFVVQQRARLELDGVTLTRIPAVIPYNGGGIVSRSATVDLRGGAVIEHVRKNANPGGPHWFSSAAIHAEHGSYLYLHHAIIRYNISEQDTGGVGLRTESRAEMHYPTQIHGNRSLTNIGGGVSIASFENRLHPGNPRDENVRRCVVFTMHGGSITNNFAQLDGGGIRIGIDATFIMHNGLIAYNYSHRRGGGVEAVEDSTFRWYGGAIRDNGRNAAGQVTTQRGGGLAVIGGSVLHVPATPGTRYLTGNASLIAGGGLFLSTAGAGASVTAVRINKSSTLIIPLGAPLLIDDNETYGDGGGIYLLNASFWRAHEAAFLNFGANVTMDDGQITNNRAHGSGGGLSVSGEGSIANLTAGVVRGNTALSGGGASVIDYAEFTLSGTARIYNNLATATGTDTANGGGVFAARGSTFILANTSPLAIHNNIARANGPNATANGGGFVIDGNELNMHPGTSFTGNRVEALNGATANGGGLAVLSGTFVLPTGRTITNNTAHAIGAGSSALGGGVLLDGTDVTGAFTAASGSNITNNNAVAENGATARGGGVSVRGGNHTIASTAVVTGNHATATAPAVGGTGALAQGGGVIVTGGTITIATGANVTNNTATASGSASFAQGGGFAAIGGQLNLNIDVENNFAIASGGGIVQGGGAFVGGGQITIIGRDITNNQATADGGNIYGVGLAMSGGIFSMSAGTEITDNISTITGGGQVFGGGVAMLLAEDGISGGTFEMTGGYILNNSAFRGGGVWMSSGTMNISGGVVRNNSATRGGGIYMIGAGSTLNMTGGVIGHTNLALGNEAAHAGGGVHLANGATLYMRRGGTALNPTYGSIIGNTSNTVTGWDIVASHGGGGVMATANSFVDIYIGVISGNRASYGGGIHARGGTILNMRGYPGGSGARIYNNEIVGGGTWDTAGGGGVIIHGTSTFNMYSGTIGHDNHALGNRSSRAAGGVYVAGGIFNMRAHVDDSIALPRIVGNTAQGTAVIDGGGGIEIWGPQATFNMYNGIIENNRALHGGGVYLEGGIMNMHGGIIQNNRYNATGGVIAHGGGIKFGNTAVVSLTMTGGTIRNNRATQGGGVRAQVAQPNVAHFNMSGGSIYGNEATTEGGGVWINNTNAVFTMTGGAVGRAAPANLPAGTPNPNANTAPSGGGVVVLNGAGFVMNTGGTAASPTIGTVTGNIATYGGGVRVIGGMGLPGSGSSFVMHDGRIYGNEAASLGGGVNVINEDAVFRMHGGIVGGQAPANLPDGDPNPYSNTAIDGGGVWVGNGARLYMEEYAAAASPSTGAIIGNNATADGGGIWVAANATVTASDATITHNIAGDMGGGIFTAHYEYACPITHYSGAAGVAPADVAYSNLVLTGVTFNHNQSDMRHIPPRNALDVIAATAFAQTSFPASPPPIRNHPLNNCDINFRSVGVDFDLHKTDAQIFDQSAWDWNNPSWVNGILLPGAHFSLYRYIGASTPTTQVSPATLYPAGNWVYVDSDISSGLIGTPISFQLYYGVYYQLVEHIAPAGYQAPFGQWQIRYGAGGLTTTPVGTVPTIHYIPCNCNTSNCEGGNWFVGNRPDFELPLTGGIGSVSASSLVAGSVALSVAIMGAGVIVVKQPKRRRRHPGMYGKI